MSLLLHCPNKIGGSNEKKYKWFMLDEKANILKDMNSVKSTGHFFLKNLICFITEVIFKLPF